MKCKRVVILVLIILFVIGGTCLYIDYSYSNFFNKTENLFNSLYQDVDSRIPVDNLNINQIQLVESYVKKIISKKEKSEMLFDLEMLKTFISIRDDVLDCFDGDALKSSIVLKTIECVSLEYKELPNYLQSILKGKVDSMVLQYNDIYRVNSEVRNFFVNDEMVVVGENVTRDEYNRVLVEVNKLLQKDIVVKLQRYLDIVNGVLIEREEAEKRRIEEIARRKREQEIADAWHILNVPYISQNLSNVFNGCEVASLLMGLQYKGYLRDISLQSYAENVPKSNDPFSGFTYSIFDLEPLIVPHWIAPAPLALYGRNSSGNLNVIDTTGYSLQDLDNQIMEGNPVVIYLTSKFKTPKPYIEGAPKNIHVMLLTGYNSITKEQIITDPWTHDDGTTRWYISKEKVEKIYNATGMRSVVIK